MIQTCDNCGSEKGRLTALDGFETLCASCEQAFADERLRTVVDELGIKTVPTRVWTISTVFTQRLREILDLHELIDIDARNRGEDKHCASHLYLDPNVEMDAAFEQVMGQPLDLTRAAHVEIFNAAWDISRRNGFTPKS